MRSHLIFLVLIIFHISYLFGEESPSDASQSQQQNSKLSAFEEDLMKRVEKAFCPLKPLAQALCNSIFKNAPDEIKNIMEVLILWDKNRGETDPKKVSLYQDSLPHKLLLVGKPGCGKTTLAIAMAQVLGRTVCLLRMPLIGNEYKNSEVAFLSRVLVDFAGFKNPMVLILDELPIVAEEKQNYLGGSDLTTSGALWLLLDECAKNPNLLIIATANDISKLPPQLKDRFNGSTIEIKADGEQTRYNVLSHYLDDFGHECTEYEIRTIAKKTKDMSPRQLKNLVDIAWQDQTVRTHQVAGLIKAQDLESAFKKCKKSSDSFNNIPFYKTRWFTEYNRWVPLLASTAHLAVFVAGIGYAIFHKSPAIPGMLSAVK